MSRTARERVVGQRSVITRYGDADGWTTLNWIVNKIETKYWNRNSIACVTCDISRPQDMSWCADPADTCQHLPTLVPITLMYTKERLSRNREKYLTVFVCQTQSNALKIIIIFIVGSVRLNQKIYLAFTSYYAFHYLMFEHWLSFRGSL